MRKRMKSDDDNGIRIDVSDAAIDGGMTSGLAKSINQGRLGKAQEFRFSSLLSLRADLSTID